MNVLGQINMMGSVLELHGESQDLIKVTFASSALPTQHFLFFQDNPVGAL